MAQVPSKIYLLRRRWGALMNGLSVCSGIGGIELGLKLAIPEYQTVGYIECDFFAADVLMVRMRDFLLPEAPIWGLVENWDRKSCFDAVDIVSAGFPCQPWSVAGKRKGIQDERWIWPHISKIIRETGPKYVFLENVVGLLNIGFGHILRDLAQSGYDAEWDVFSAQACGAPHLRQRLFILAYAQGCNVEWVHSEGRQEGDALRQTGGNCTGVQNSKFKRSNMWGAKVRKPQVRPCGDQQDKDELPLWPPGPADYDSWERVLTNDPTLEPAICRVVDGVSQGLDQSLGYNLQKRLRSVGNAVAPIVAAVAFLTLAERAASAPSIVNLAHGSPKNKPSGAQ